tara:strand:+ start:3907 stop:4482 length:576 start_codon:yes stop_codon:yes gene_type:complete
MDELKLYNISKVKNDVYFSKAVNKDGLEITLQFKTKCTLDIENKKAKLEIKEFEVFNEVTDKILNITHKNSNNWFNKTIELNDLKNIYKNALEDNQLHVFYTDDTVFYNKTKNLTLDELSDECIQGTVLIRLLGVVYTKTSFFCRWEIILFKVKENNQEKVYLIRDIEEDNESLSNLDLNLEKSLENLTLF